MALRSLAREPITVADSAIGFTASNITAYTIMAKCRLSTAQVRVSCISDPTDALGFPVDPGDTLEVWGHPDLQRFRAIRTGAVSAVLDVEYFGEGGSGW